MREGVKDVQLADISVKNLKKNKKQKTKLKNIATLCSSSPSDTVPHLAPLSSFVPTRLPLLFFFCCFLPCISL